MVAEFLAELCWQREYVLDQIVRLGQNKYRRDHLDSLVWAIDELGEKYPEAIAPALAKLKSRISDRMRRPR